MKIKSRAAMRVAALGAAGALVSLSISPAAAADVVAQSGANALTIGIAGNAQGTGFVTATHTGTGQENVEGMVNPPIAVLGNQGLLNVGVLAQNATAGVEGRRGISAACAGVAGDGGAIAEVGDSDCITPGQPVGISIANLDLTGAQLINEDAVENALAPLAPLNAIIDVLVGPLTNAIVSALAPLADVGLGGTLGAVQASCEAEPGRANGTANIVDGRLSVTLPGVGEVVLVRLPVNPAPNTHVVTDLDLVLDAVLEAVRIQLEEALDGLAGPLAGITEQVRNQIVPLLIAPLADALAPLEDNILDITLNKQTRPEQGRVEVTALDLQVLPAAQQFVDASLLEAQIATVTCGVNSTYNPTPDPQPEPQPDPDPEPEPEPDLPDIPTEVDAGATGTGVSLNGGAMGAALLTLTAAAGLAGYRRLGSR